MAIKTNPNQKVVTVHKETKPLKDYTYFSLDTLRMARKNLKPGAFMLWTYIADNKDGWEFGLSSSDFFDNTTMGKSAYDNAVKELIEKGYLVLRSGKTLYDFYDRPLCENQTTKD